MVLSGYPIIDKEVKKKSHLSCACCSRFRVTEIGHNDVDWPNVNTKIWIEFSYFVTSQLNVRQDAPRKCSHTCRNDVTHWSNIHGQIEGHLPHLRQETFSQTKATLTLTAQIKIFLVSLWFIASKFRAVNLHTCTKSGAYWLRPKAVNTAEGVRFNSYCDNISTLPRCQNVTNPFFPSKLLK